MNDIARRLGLIANRRQITDVINCYCGAIDRNELTLFSGVFWPDAEYGPGVIAGRVDRLAGPMMASSKTKYADMQHRIGNILIDLQGDQAFVEATLPPVTAAVARLPATRGGQGAGWRRTSASTGMLRTISSPALGYVARF